MKYKSLFLICALFISICIGCQPEPMVQDGHYTLQNTTDGCWPFSQPQRPSRPETPGSGAGFEFAKQFQDSVGLVQSGNGHGSCFFIGNFLVDGKPCGVHITAGHVVDSCGSNVDYAGKYQAKATVYCSTSAYETDSAVLLTPVLNNVEAIPVVDEGSQTALYAGIGFPPSKTLTIVGGTYKNRVGTWMQEYVTSPAAFHGMSGGPMVCDSGVVGIIVRSDDRSSTLCVDMSYVLSKINLELIPQQPEQPEGPGGIPMPRPMQPEQTQKSFNKWAIIPTLAMVLICLTFLVCRMIYLSMYATKQRSKK